MSVKETLKARRKTHGEYKETALISQTFKDAARSGSSWSNMTAAQKESVDMVLHKVARIVCGNPNEPDHWVDIQGYAKLAEEGK